MAWDHLSITKPHLVYIILGGFTTLFMLCSSVIKERMYIGEATVATICGLIFGPHAADLINPQSWGSVDIVTVEFSRIVLVVQCFAVGVELPKFYMERHWKSVVFLLVPVMTFGWLITSLFIWWMIPPLNWLESLVVAACVTATDPVLASSVVGKGKFAKRVPKHLRDLLSAESGCNDGMAFPFIYLSLYLIQDRQSAKDVSFHWIVYTILYECVFGAIFGFLIGYIARHGIKFAEKHDLIDRESFLVFYFVLALFCAGSGSILGVDDLLVGFAAGVGFSNDGWFGNKTEESHVSNVIDLLLNLTYFVYLGTIVPWEMFNDEAIGLTAWRLTVIAILVIFFRRIPIMMALKPFIPDVKTWREALFAGHFGPIGVGAIFVAILARAELEADTPVPLAQLPPPDHEHYVLLTLVWPIVTFLVISSILVHGSSIAVFTLGKHINTLTITMSYTTAPEDGPSWMNRLPRISSQSRSQARTMSDTDMDELKLPDFPPGTLPPVGFPGHFLRRVKEEDKDNPSRAGSRASSIVSRRRKKKWDDGIGPGGPISQSAIFPQRRSQSERTSATLQGDSPGHSPPDRQDTGTTLEALSRRDSMRDADKEEGGNGEERGERHSRDEVASPGQVPAMEVYDEGDHIVVENEQGDVIAVEETPKEQHPEKDVEALKEKLTNELKAEASSSAWTYDNIKKKIGHWKNEEVQKRREKQMDTRKHEPARAYQFGNTIIVEDEDGEVVKKYELPTQRPEKEGPDLMSQGLKYMGMGGLIKASDKTADGGGEGSKAAGKASMPSWMAFGRQQAGEPSERQRKKSVAEEKAEQDDRHIRFTIGGVGQRMNKNDFINEMKKLDNKTRREVVDHSTASNRVKTLAKQDPVPTFQITQHSSPRGEASPAASSSSPAPAASRGKAPEAPRGRPRSATSSSMSSSVSSEISPGPTRGRQGAPTSEAVAPSSSSKEEPETAVERRRRLAVLQSVGDEQGDDDTNETPAERRRREAALGMASPTADSDSEDDDTPRVPPARRGIRFADDASPRNP
ncbi:uncharacterized protein E0L32_009362 [Thyridium curvatum]|uniref:Na+/H+ antiporter n=1 Tax=Thyridium curvatum TaxID=1093900 RepID=A0A507ASH1_9PEZI|nr:uncharacterized protein E0L32_009362 [Thyridium curvatum]TPX09474.1 hypothetical protein E0L32_009362 [Thyridium curvatum]